LTFAEWQDNCTGAKALLRLAMSGSSKSGDVERKKGRKVFPTLSGVGNRSGDQTPIFVRKSLQSLDGLRDISTVNRQKA
jgi:hypothetical protein